MARPNVLLSLVRAPALPPQHAYFGVNLTPRTTAVFASDPALPRRPQDSLPPCLLGFGRTRLALASSYRLLLSHPAPGSYRRSDGIGQKAFSAGPYSIRARAAPLSMRVPVLCPEHAAPPSLPPAAPLPSTPSAAAHHGLVRALHRYYERIRLLIRSLTDCPL